MKTTEEIMRSRFIRRTRRIRAILRSVAAKLDELNARHAAAVARQLDGGE